MRNWTSRDNLIISNFYNKSRSSEPSYGPDNRIMALSPKPAYYLMSPNLSRPSPHLQLIGLQRYWRCYHQAIRSGWPSSEAWPSRTHRNLARQPNSGTSAPVFDLRIQRSLFKVIANSRASPVSSPLFVLASSLSYNDLLSALLADNFATVATCP